LMENRLNTAILQMDNIARMIEEKTVIQKQESTALII